MATNVLTSSTSLAGSFVGQDKPESHVVPDVDKQPFLLIASTMEKCYECGYVYAVACSPGVSDCGMPYTQAVHYYSFASEAEALNYLSTHQELTLVALVKTQKIEIKAHEDDVITLPDPIHSKVKRYDPVQH